MNRKYNKMLVTNAKSLRRNMTDEERHLWYDFLRFYPIKFRRQAVIDKYIADFYCPSANLVIELDGSQHFEDEEIKYDKMRTEFLEQYGLTVVRLPNNFIHEKFKEVCEYIDDCTRRLIEQTAGSEQLQQSPQSPDGDSPP